MSERGFGDGRQLMGNHFVVGGSLATLGDGMGSFGGRFRRDPPPGIHDLCDTTFMSTGNC